MQQRRLRPGRICVFPCRFANADICKFDKSRKSQANLLISSISACRIGVRKETDRGPIAPIFLLYNEGVVEEFLTFQNFVISKLYI